MFKKGDIVRMIGVEHLETYVVTRTSATIITGYNIAGKPKFTRSREYMEIKPQSNPDYPGIIVVDKSHYEYADGCLRKIKKHNFLNNDKDTM